MNQIINYQSGITDITKLPSHFKREHLEQMINKVKEYYSNKKDKRGVNLCATYIILFELMWNTGGRIGEVLRLRTCDINFDKKMIILDVTKTDKKLEIPFDAELAYLLNNYILMNHLNKEDKLIKMTRQNAWMIVKKYGLQIGITKSHPHMFRHGIALHLTSQGVSPAYIQALLGHSDIRTTMHMYSKITPEILREGLQGKMR